MNVRPGAPHIANPALAEPEDPAELKKLAGAIAHELNNVLTGVLGNLSLLEEAGQMDGNGVSAIAAEALLAARRGISISEKLEAFAERLRLEPASCDMNGLLKEAVWQLRGALGPTEVRFTPRPERPMVRVDGAMMVKAIVSLGVTVAAAFQEGAEVLRLESGTVERADLRGLSLPVGSYAHTRLSWVGHAARTDIISDGLRRPYSGPRATRKSNWGLASVAGFIRQSGGEFLLSTCAQNRIDMDLYIPVEA